MDVKSQQARVNRFNRIAGQLRGIAQMVADDRYCIDILDQIQAAKAAIARAENEVLRHHAARCVSEAIDSGDAAAQRQKVDELVQLMARAKR